ncbi:MAG: rhomboid family intramembrane serine protease [Pseudorhodoplanes sp.]
MTTTDRQPIFNVPAVVVLIIAALCAVHGVRTFLSEQQDFELLLLFAFIPARYEPSILPGAVFPGGLAADIWTFVTYAFLHGGMLHLGINAVWLLAFGSPVARRLGSLRFCILFAATAAAGAAAHLFAHTDARTIMVGASAAISGAMAAAIRFCFQPEGPLRNRFDESAYFVPAIGLRQALTNRQILTFLAVWFGINLLAGLGFAPGAGDDQPVAWQAHIGGFVAGLVLFGFFDPVPPEKS